MRSGDYLLQVAQLGNSRKHSTKVSTVRFNSQAVSSIYPFLAVQTCLALGIQPANTIQRDAYYLCGDAVALSSARATAVLILSPGWSSQSLGNSQNGSNFKPLFPHPEWRAQIRFAKPLCSEYFPCTPASCMMERQHICTECSTSKVEIHPCQLSAGT